MRKLDNTNYNIKLEKLCDYLKIGTLTSEPQQLTGGLLHRMYAVETSSGKNAVKALNPNIMLRSTARRNITEGELIASFASRFIPALPAKQFYGDVIINIDNQHYLVYDWYDGKSLYNDNITVFHCEKIGSILGRIHSTDFSSLNIEKPAFTVEEITDWNDYLQKGLQAQSPWTKELSKIIDSLYDWNQRYLNSIKYLERSSVIGHGDIDPKNVLWHNDNPVIIDWESAGYLNPAHEFIIYALYWSECNGQKDKSKFAAFREGYLKSARFDETDWRIVMDAGLSPHWLEYNLKRSLGIECADADEQQMGTEQIFSTVRYLKNYEASIPLIVSWLSE